MLKNRYTAANFELIIYVLVYVIINRVYYGGSTNHA